MSNILDDREYQGYGNIKQYKCICIDELRRASSSSMAVKMNNCRLHGNGTIYSRFHYIMTMLDKYIPNKFSARAPELQALEIIEKMYSFVKDYADEPCEYNDNCPRFVKLNHYECRPCRARRALLLGRENE